MQQPLPPRIEEIYHGLRTAGGQSQQSNLGVAAQEVKAGFARTVHELAELSDGGRFYEGRTSLRELAESGAAQDHGPLHNTGLLAASLGLPRWCVHDHSELDFHYVDRELVPSRVEIDGKGRYVDEHRVRLDLLLVNANPGDHTPIVTESKIGNDENALLALVQALAAAAQLSSASQRRRFTEVYPEHFGDAVPERMDVYVLMHNPPPKGIRPELFKMATTLAGELQRSGELGEWLRRIAFLRTTSDRDPLAFETAAEVFELGVV